MSQLQAMRTQQRAVPLVGTSPAMVDLKAEIERVSRSSPVLITGESGCGKELVAQAVHAGSSRAQREFVAVNCAGLPETLLESELFGHVKGSFTGAYRDKLGKLELADRDDVPGRNRRDDPADAGADRSPFTCARAQTSPAFG